jgi:hypothetical protein
MIRSNKNIPGNTKTKNEYQFFIQHFGGNRKVIRFIV